MGSMLIRRNRQLSRSALVARFAVALTSTGNRGYPPMRITREDSKDRQVGTGPDATALSDPTQTSLLLFVPTERSRPRVLLAA